MMYIDQAPLGGNLVNIYKKSASLSDAAETPTTENSAPHTKELTLHDNDDGQTTKKATVNGEHTSLLNGKQQNITETLNNIRQILESTITKNKLANSDKAEEEDNEEDKTGYVLYDIDPDAEEESPEKLETKHKVNVDCLEQNLTNGFNTCDKISPTASSDFNKQKNSAGETATTFTKKRTRETYEAEEEDCEEFIIQIKPVPKLNVAQPKPSIKPRRPLPAAIPIADFIAKSEKCVLNKYLSRPASRAYEHQNPEEQAIETEDFVVSSALDEDLEPLANQMGINILSTVWNYLSNRKSKPQNCGQEEFIASGSKRKRSLGISQPAAPPLIKYRRVDNNFPKIITGTLDDDLENYPAFQQRSLNRQRPIATQQIFGFPNTFEMSKRSENSLLPQRRSLFEAPQKQIVRNTSYADYEYSDDDDDDDSSQTRRLRHTLGIYGGGVLQSQQRQQQQQQREQYQPKVRNIPIQIEQQAKTRPPMYMQPFAAASTVSSTNYMDSMRQQVPTYADAVKQMPLYGTTGSSHILGRRPVGSSNNSSGDGASSSRFCNALGKSSARINSKGLGGSILHLEREKLDHEYYKQLLDAVSATCAGNRQQNYLLSDSVFSRPQSRNTISSSKKKTNLCDGKLKVNLPPTHRTPLSSTVNIDDDDESTSDDVIVTGISDFNAIKSARNFSKATPLVSSINIDDDGDDEISEIIDLGDDDDNHQEIAKTKKKTANEIIDLDAKENEFDDLPYVEPVNTFRDLLQTTSLKDDWVQNFNSKWERKGKFRQEEVGKTLEIAENSKSQRLACESDLRMRFQGFYIVDPELVGVDDFEKPEVEEVPEFPELKQERIKAAVCGPPDQVLVEKFNLRITRRDIHTLLGLNWLNDEVINFYMSMITDRSERKHESHGYPKVYAMNTFFLQRVLQSGHGGVKRWTRKIDIFEKDIIPVPVHVGGVHWCMAIIHLKNRWIRYYDSMGAPNPNVLRALEQYLKDESLDKRKQPFDTSDFVIESVADVPRQQNGSDCGVFSCMFAEYTARNKPITFEQKHMEYFRHKMILEIVQGELLL